MTVEQEVLGILLGETDVLTMLWDRVHGWQTLSGGMYGICTDAVRENGVFGLTEQVAEADRALYQEYADKLRSGIQRHAPAVLEVPLHLCGADGNMMYMLVKCHLGKDEEGLVSRMLLRISPLTPEERYRISLAHEITNDKHPAYFNREAEALLKRFPDQKFALIQFDVAKFKMINEQYGEARGNELLQFFIDSLKVICNEQQLYVRLTADVFMILTPYNECADLEAFVRMLNDRLSGFQGISYRLVFGICPVTDRNGQLRRFGDGAALARQSIKTDALHYFAYYEESMTNTARMNKYIEDHMERALENHEFVMYLQPKYSISRGEMIGAEALVRWNDPERGLIPPMEFIPLFEKNGFVVRMDHYIWEEACRAIRGWMDAGVEPLPISVNMSRRHLKNTDFIDVLNELVLKYRIPKSCLEIEITETVDESNKDEGVRLLKENGYTLLMDDFGSGYSSLNMLKDTQFDVLKIDRGFLQNFMSSGRGQEIVRYTIGMTKAIGLDLIAEGVETREQEAFLSDCGCDIAQGFYYAKPMPLEEFDKLLKSFK